MYRSYLLRKLQDWTFTFRLRCGHKIMYDENRRIVKVWPDTLIKGPCSEQELEAMEFAQTLDSVNSPRIRRVYHRKDGIFISMEFIRGDRLDRIWPQLTNEERRETMEQLWVQIRQLHACILPEALRGRVVAAGSISGRSAGDGSLARRVDDRPYRELSDFQAALAGNRMLGALSHLWSGDRVGNDELCRTSFVHGDLVARNVIKDQRGRLVLIDWEFAGWWPIYWEQVKWHFSDFPQLDGWVELMDEFSALSVSGSDDQAVRDAP